ncbi:hypothetical protein PIB30_029275 [Stylosanthes scabra]|uniref:Uncharacterized protein n=1 Tax=Stylosanthes scabra TaxID=79078 RepID=A0ABU6VAQ0_9FABA|nr:hypothetical protein [Stylosanthes scabra]
MRLGSFSLGIEILWLVCGCENGGCNLSVWLSRKPQIHTLSRGRVGGINAYPTTQWRARAMYLALDTPARVGELYSLWLKAPYASQAWSERLKSVTGVQPKYRVRDSGRSAQDAKEKVYFFIGVDCS